MKCDICKEIINVGTICNRFNLFCCGECFDAVTCHYGVLNLQKKITILKQRRKKCEECGSEEYLEGHHIIPKCKGGEDKFKNLIILCKECHKLRHKKRGG